MKEERPLFGAASFLMGDRAGIHHSLRSSPRKRESRDANSDSVNPGSPPCAGTSGVWVGQIQTRLLHPGQAIECALQDEGGGVLINHGSTLFAADIGRDQFAFDRNS